MLHQLRDVFAKERERRIGNDKVRIIKKFLTLRRTEVSVGFQFRQHILLVLANVDWIMKVASVINNYVHYAEEKLQKRVVI